MGSEQWGEDVAAVGHSETLEEEDQMSGARSFTKSRLSRRFKAPGGSLFQEE